MASTRSRAWGPTHPSAAFLIKCAKEREKLRSTLQAQLQEHMLHMLKNKLFADTLIAVDSGKQSVNENKFSTQCLHPNLPQLHHAHKSLLKVRVPAFYNHLTEHKETHLGIESYNSFLGESELQQFLGNVYSDDDIRKHECEALRLSKKYIELSCQNKGPVNKHIADVDEFEKESVNSTCTDTFVTPKTSPVSPENKVDVSDMFRSAQNHSKRSSKGEKANNSQNDAYNSTTFSAKSVIKKERTGNIHLDTSTEEDLNGDCDRSIEGSKILLQGKDIMSGYSSRNDDEISDQESEPDNYSNVGGMVRSNTFDLETQGPLEDAIDDRTEWCFRSEAQINSKSKDSSVEKESTRKLDGTGFFLHDHTPSPKSSLFKHGFPREAQYSSGHESDSSSGLHIRRFDGSMSDSGFLSHSTFSVISDTGIPNSISSSLILSSEDACSPPVTGAHMSELSSSNLEKSKHLSGSMFPFYIDMNSLPPPSPNSKAEKKLSPSHTYMYIDARNPRSNMSVRKKLSYMNTSYDEFLTELEASNNYSSKEPLTKAQSTSQLDVYREEFVINGKRGHHTKSRPQSCYMYVDLDSVKDEPYQKQNRSNFEEASRKQEQSVVAMFINLHEASNQNGDAHDVDSDNTELDISGEVDSKTVQEIMKITREYQASNQRRKLSDSSLTETVYELSDPNLKYFSLTKKNESRSVSSLDYQSVSCHDEPPKSRTPTFVRKAHSAHRYSDGVYYDNLYTKKVSPNFCSSNDGKIWNDSKNCQVKDMKILNQAVKLLHNFRNEESSGSCSNLGKIDSDDKLDSFDKLKWKSTGDMGKSKYSSTNDEHGLLPMSPILRRKSQSRDAPKSAPPPVVVKASTKPQDVDAMKFPKSLIEETSKIPNKSPPAEIKPETSQNALKQVEKLDDVKSSCESLKLGSEEPSELSDSKDKRTDSVSRSGSSGMTASGGDSSSERHITHDAVKEKMAHSSLSFSVSCDFEDDSETIYSEVSDVSSSLGGIASLERHWRETHKRQGEFTSQNSTINYQLLEACSKLGEDLLRMFLEEIDTDIVVEVDGKEIKAHRCILASRCKYFANLLRRSNPDKNSSTISLEGFSHSAVHFALCHIYSGAMNIPKDCNISELALLADMLNLETLTDVIVFHLKMHFCHFFHRPCLQCVQGVVECLPLAAVCGLNELRDKCIYWLGKYFTRTWPNKSFAALTEELRELCYNVTAHNLAIDTVIDMTLNCDRLMNTLPQLKWTEPIFGMVTKLLQDCIHFMAKNFNKILNSETFIALGKGQSWNITALEDDIISSIELTTPDIACRSYVTVNNLLLLTESEETTEYGEFTQNFVDLLHKISRHCERYLIQNANKVVHCESWACLSPQVQKRIRDAAVIVFEFEKPTAPPPRLSSLQRKLKKQSEADDSGCLERSTYPKKGKNMYLKKHPPDATFSPKHALNTQHASEQKDRLSLRKETENIIKKIVSPIKEEAQNNSIDHSVHDTSYDILSSALNLHNSPCYFSNKGYIDAHEEDSLRDLQDLPQDQSQSPVPFQGGRESLLVSGVAAGDRGGSRSPTHCSDNPDSLEVNEEISSDSKDEVDALLSNEDGSNQEKGLNETPEVLEKNFASLERKKFDNLNQDPERTDSPMNKISVSVNIKEKVPVSQPLILHSDENNKYNKIQTERSPVKKAHGKSFVPLAKSYGTEVKKSPPSPDTKSKDLVAEIDADSRMVSHCLQEAEMLEQQLSRKLQRQHQVGSSNVAPYSPNKAHGHSDHHKSSKSHTNRLQKASSTSQIKNLAGASVRGKSPGRIVKSNASSPSIGHAPRMLKAIDSPKDKTPVRKSSQSPKSIVTSTQRSFRSMESIASVQKQLSVSVSQVSRRISSRSSRPKAINVTGVRTPIAAPKGL